jgi:hypothetical protein
MQTVNTNEIKDHIRGCLHFVIRDLVPASATRGFISTEIGAMWESTMTKCGDTTWAPVFGGIAKYKDFAWVTTEVRVSDMDRNMNHVEWTVSTSIKPGTSYRV